MRIAVAMLLLAMLTACGSWNWRQTVAQWAEASCEAASNCTIE